MKITGEQIAPELVNLQPIGQQGLGNAIPVVLADCADDAPC